MIHPHIVTTLSQYTRLGLCGGATGGHVYPVSSLVQYIQSSDKINSKIQNYYRIGGAGQMEEQEYKRLKELQSQTPIDFLPIISGKMRRYLDLENIILNLKDILKVLIGTIQSIYYLLRYRINAVFCKGGYMALPVVLASIILRIPLYIHESDSHYGLTHRIARRRAKQIRLGMASADRSGDPRITVTGQILSPELEQFASTPADVLSLQSRYPDAYPILVTPGSLGSQVIFDQLLDIIPKFGCHYIWYIVCGALNTQYVSKFASFPNIVVYPQVTPGLMGCLYHQAQGAIIRGGVTTLAECEYFKLKTIACPLAYAHDQADNIAHYTQLYPQQFFYRQILTDQDIQQIFC